MSPVTPPKPANISSTTPSPEAPFDDSPASYHKMQPASSGKGKAKEPAIGTEQDTPVPGEQGPSIPTEHKTSVEHTHAAARKRTREETRETTHLGGRLGKTAAASESVSSFQTIVQRSSRWQVALYYWFVNSLFVAAIACFIAGCGLKIKDPMSNTAPFLISGSSALATLAAAGMAHFVFHHTAMRLFDSFRAARRASMAVSQAPEDTSADLPSGEGSSASASTSPV